ncbi:MAG TPA: helix-turn-helix domain-containing protein [Actinocrinis sp.]|uniref:helix-turn-helix domain-containing protein n=1 Tax=Actinocrinis sp. TaxID=1920516 RepID=UPI002D621DE1|nr:helix-turn-helix domain-containing protein [Actinocrinis sp.]HZU58506.1 helix-turn-helix domain-containing protein [Actinocrinis sp.]
MTVSPEPRPPAGAASDTPADAPAGTPAARFAAALRELRTRAGSPSFREMGRAVNYAPSTLSDAVSGKRLPTRAVVEAFARACDADPQEWGERWARAVGENAGLPAAGEQPEAVIDPPAAAPEPPSRRGRTVLRDAALVVLTAAIAATVTWFASPRDAGSTPAAATGLTATPSAFTTPADGQDPAAVGCGTDTVVLGESQVKIGPADSGTLELKYSPRCQAGWARFYLNPNSTPVFAEVRVQASDGRASAFAYLAQGTMPVYTDLLHPGGGCLKASVIVHPQNQDPITAATPCLQGR